MEEGRRYFQAKGTADRGSESRGVIRVEKTQGRSWCEVRMEGQRPDHSGPCSSG